MNQRSGKESALTRGGNGQPTAPAIDATSCSSRPSPNGRARPPEPNAERFPLVTSAALDSQDYTPSWIVIEVLCALVPAVIGGLFKTCKSLVAIAQAIAIASGRPFLNTFTVPTPMSVIYFSGEGGPTVAQDYGRRVAHSMGLELGDVKNLHWCFSVPRLESLSDLDAMTRAADDVGATVVYIDNLMLALSGDDPGNVFRMGQILGNVIRVCSERGVTPVFVHHFRRTRATADQYAPGELLDLTQAGPAETAGQWGLLTRREPYNPDQPGEHRLWLNIGGRMGNGRLHALDVHEGRQSDPGGRRWDVELSAPSAVRQSESKRIQAARDGKRQAERDARSEAAKKAIVQAMAKVGPATKSAIMHASGVHQRDFAGPFAELIQSGDVVPCEVHAKNRSTPYPGFALAGSDAATPTLAQVWSKI